MRSSEIAFIVSYRCPRCQAALEATTSRLAEWLRCPKCGRASLPPDVLPRRPVVQPLDEDTLIIGPEFGVDASSDSRSGKGQHGISVRRILLGVGILTALSGLIFGLLEQNAMRVGISGVATLLMFTALSATSRRR